MKFSAFFHILLTGTVWTSAAAQRPLYPTQDSVYRNCTDRGDAEFATSKFKKALHWYQLSVRINDLSALTAIRMAAAYAHTGKVPAAEERLRRAAFLRPTMLQDSLRSEHYAAHFSPHSTLLNTGKTACEDALQNRAAQFDSTLAQELSRRRDEDQYWRSKIHDPEMNRDSVIRHLIQTDSANTQWLKSIVRETGWPGSSRAGVGGSSNAWLLVQHADQDTAFQAEVLPLLWQACLMGEASFSHYAYLEDRIFVARYGWQNYGTQFYSEPGTGLMKPRPIQNPENLEARRKNFGMEPFADYRKRMTGE